LDLPGIPTLYLWASTPNAHAKVSPIENIAWTNWLVNLVESIDFNNV
jgi:hypothetical protein